MGKPICNAMKRLGWGAAVVCLQEVPKWVNGSVFAGHVVHSHRSRDDRAANRDGFDCGFLVPKSLNPLIRDEIHRPYWSGLLLSDVLIFSIHFLHSQDVASETNIDRIRQETQDYYHACNRKYAHKDFSIVAGFDANVTLPPNNPGSHRRWHHLQVTQRPCNNRFCLRWNISVSGL